MTNSTSCKGWPGCGLWDVLGPNIFNHVSSGFNIFNLLELLRKGEPKWLRATFVRMPPDEYNAGVFVWYTTKQFIHKTMLQKCFLQWLTKQLNLLADKTIKFNS